MSFSVPLLSGVVGVLNDKFLNIWLTSKLQVVLQTTYSLLFTIQTGTSTASASYNVVLNNFSLQCEYVYIGLNALSILDNTQVDGKAYSHGMTYSTSSANINSGSSGA